MGQVSRASDAELDRDLLRLVLDEHEQRRVPRLNRCWAYFRNAADWTTTARVDGEERVRRRFAQEVGLPDRIRFGPRAAGDDRAVQREIVIENDIAWRVQAMVDFMFGRPVRIASVLEDEGERRAVGALLDSVWERSGGIALLQDLALLGHVYGHVDLLLRVDWRGLRAAAGRDMSLEDLAPLFRIEVVEPLRGVPVLSPGDYRVIDAYAIRARQVLNDVSPEPTMFPWQRAERFVRRQREWLEVHTTSERRVYVDGELVEATATPWTGGEVPVAHIQNIAQPFRYEGMGEVEPLIPLQDELNTRLSDRASRVTLQSFQMYLAKGLEGFDQGPVGPGTVWSTDNPDASIQSFGGDGASPSEDAHIEQIREAMDKQSGVPPLAAGVVRARIGNLSSANALRVTLLGVLSKTARKRVTYGRGIARICSLVLGAIDAAGVREFSRAERSVRLDWPDPLPEGLTDEVNEARGKIELGVDRERVLRELGYGTGDAGVA
ncbi:MAG: phage portal protein [Planctomycetota bacterium]